MNIQLVDDARAWWKMYSNWVFMFIQAMGILQVFLPFISWALPSWLLGIVLFLIGTAGLAARLIKQFKLGPREEGLMVVGGQGQGD